ncbi:50S ribosomal protein L19-1, chloroplastic [Coffea eugenioides]|uniref:Large ribosomal subunit protein bL19cz n=1 Tax=Coffea arabica TaxID=13443 RepID=A0A6P6TWH9_COFAR|nr:50S ribosomal protein L19-1, chloroplastic-like [Coffea arabica]XP_027181260.1 50S ribosomal protein L19-1, chloroplastic [Coffea eugenioides]
MVSNVLPQALYMIPRNTAQCSQKKLSFSAMVSGRPSSSFSSRVSLNWSGFGFEKLKGNQSFVVRAEGDADGVEAENVENEEDIGETVAEVGAAEGEAEVVAVETEEKPPRKPIIKLGDIMQILNTRAIEESDKVRPTPDIRTGDIVEIKLEVPETRRRLSVYKGIVISKQNAGIHTTIRIRRIIAGVGVEIVFPIYSPNIKEIRVVSHRKVRRARLYYLRDKLPRLSTFK